MDDPADFVEDGEHLSQLGNRKVAVFMQMHLCNALANNTAKCPFFKPEDYIGKAYLPNEAGLDHAMEASKEKKLRKLFWGYE